MIVRELLTADQMSLTAYVGGTGNVGIGLLGTWVGTATFYGSTDGLNFFLLAMTPFASGTAVNNATATGNFFTPTKNLIAVRVVFSRTSGSLQVNIAASNDGSWQEAFITNTTVCNSSSATSGTNTLTQASQANRAWKLLSCEVSIAGPGFNGTGRIDIYDGAVTGTKLYTAFLTPPVGSVGTVQKINLPSDPATNDSKVVGTPGNAMTIVVSGVPNQSTVINAAFSAG